MMLSNDHRQSEELSFLAAKAKSDGRLKESRDLYARAAEFEKSPLSKIPEDKIRTRSILSLSVASLLYKAKLLDETELFIFGLLASDNLEPWSTLELRELLAVVSDEKTLETTLKRRYSGENIMIALRGGEIGSGTGPLDLILETASGFRSLLNRFAEYIGNYPLRRYGNPPKEIIESIQARISQPIAGSYKMEIRLTEPLQYDLFQPDRIQPKKISDTIFSFYNQLTLERSKNLIEIIPQEDYRKAFLQLTKNIVPTGKRMQEIGIYRKKGDKIESVYLTNAVAPKIKSAIHKMTKEVVGEYIEKSGTLQALHLDKNWLQITLLDGKPLRCDTVHDMLDDVVGPMVNREVKIRGPMKYKRGVESLLVQEIELAEED